jgi:pyrimidine-nucleoside phosphorylase
MNFLSLLEAKRDGKEFSEAEISWLIAEFTASRIPDYQMAPLLMAVFFRGLNREETRAWTLAMRDSGEVLRFPADARPLVDKHSTGGVGDKISLVLAPLLACLGFRVPMISGRGLGITGGTLDKLESIPGFNTALTAEQIIKQVQTVGCVICGQTDRMVPADKAMYALRDVTGTVPSIPLITASILSKKLAEGIQALLLDVKFGSAAFMQTPEKAIELARAMVELGKECSVDTRALITDMNAPLGRTAGNWLEVKEAVDCLEGKGPNDLEQLTVECAAQLLSQMQKISNLQEVRTKALACLHSGKPRDKWNELLVAQGADLRAFDQKFAVDTTAKQVVEVWSDSEGVVSECDASVLGKLVRDMGAGRLTKEASINHDVGIDRLAKRGDHISAGGLLCRLHATDMDCTEAVQRHVRSAFRLTDKAEPPMLIREVIS